MSRISHRLCVWINLKYFRIFNKSVTQEEQDFNFSFRIKANEENKEDEYQSWMEVSIFKCIIFHFIFEIRLPCSKGVLQTIPNVFSSVWTLTVFQVFKKACCLKRSSESIDVEKVNEITETSFTEKVR